MDFTNHTRYPAALFRSIAGETKLVAAVAVRVTYDLAAGELLPAEGQPWVVSPGPWDSPRGKLRGDELYYREGCDLFVFGSARPPGGKPAPRADVTVRLGDKFKHTLAVFGDRRWEKRGRRWEMTPPKPFAEVPLTMANAFGGKDEWDELPVPFGANPEGKGFRMTEDLLPGTPLPNIEDPDHLIANWDDAPDPVGTCVPPVGFGPRLLKSVEYDRDSGEITKIKALFFNSAFPGMVAPVARTGDVFAVTGVRANGPIKFALPAPPVKVRMAFGGEASDWTPYIDQVGLEADEDRVFVSFRFPFKYHLVAMQKRACDVLPAGGV